MIILSIFSALWFFQLTLAEEATPDAELQNHARSFLVSMENSFPSRVMQSNTILGLEIMNVIVENRPQVCIATEISNIFAIN